ncbi:MAG: desulfoferrodoxin family protein [Mycoplasmatota bacterium]|nr:desulfoferrodoxin family protein [Mycoplasmatota bacterium]
MDKIGGDKIMKELILKKCLKCGSLIKIIEDCNCSDCGIVCCGESMSKIIPNSVDASAEKHVPCYEIIGKEMKISVNHVMEDDHYIEWILVKTENENMEKIFKSGEVAEFVVPYVKGSIIYAYCNKHGLWKKEVE